MLRGWTTWDGRKIPAKEITHQHLSNIYYYTHFVLPQCYDNETRKDVYRFLMSKFGSILPYKPDVNFAWEKNYLKERGFLMDNNDIVILGRKLGVYGQ